MFLNVDGQVNLRASRSVYLMSRLKVYGYIVYFALLLLSFLPYLASNLCYLDELKLLAESKRILLFGEHQHRDFFEFEGSGNYYLIALVWRLLGRIDYQSIKLLTFLAIITGGVLLTIIARRFTKRFWLSILPSLIFVGYLGHTFPFSNHHWFGSVSSIVFLFFLTRYLERFRLRDLYWCGFTSASSLLFIMHEGIVNTLAGAIVVVVVIWLLPRSSRPDANKLAAVYLAGFSTVALPVLTFYVYIGALGQYIYETFLWPFANYRRPGGINTQPWAVDLNLWSITDAGHFTRVLFFLSTSAAWLLVLLPVVAIVAGGGLLVATRISGSARGHHLMLLGLVVLSVGIYATAFSQPSLIKLLWGSVPSLILTVLLADRLADRFRDLPAARRALGFLLAFAILAIATVPIYRSGKMFRGDESELSGAEAVRKDHPVIELINSESGPQDYFFGYKWTSLFYYALNARPATRYTLFSENYLSDEQLRDLFSDLERHRPKFMTFSSDHDLLWLVSQNERFANLLNEHYRLRGRIGQWLVYQRRD